MARFSLNKRPTQQEWMKEQQQRKWQLDKFEQGSLSPYILRGWSPMVTAKLAVIFQQYIGNCLPADIMEDNLMGHLA